MAARKIQKPISILTQAKYLAHFEALKEKGHPVYTMEDVVGTGIPDYDVYIGDLAYPLRVDDKYTPVEKQLEVIVKATRAIKYKK